MKYDIYLKPHLENKDAYFSVEIVPPIGELAATGLCKILERNPRDSGLEGDPEADLAVMTRNDKEGTAFQIYPYKDIEPDDAMIATENMAVSIDIIIDPTERHDVEYHYPEGLK